VANKGGGYKPRRFPDVRPEYVVLGFLAEKPAHGYELRRRFSASLDGLWHISESHLYGTLKRMEGHGHIEGSDSDAETGLSRRLFILTPVGRALFESWLSEPTIGSPRSLRLEFLARLYFARLLKPDALSGIIAGQLEAVGAELKEMSDSRSAFPVDRITNDLARAFRISQLRAAREWLEEVVGKTV